MRTKQEILDDYVEVSERCYYEFIDRYREQYPEYDIDSDLLEYCHAAAFSDGVCFERNLNTSLIKYAIQRHQEMYSAQNFLIGALVGFGLGLVFSLFGVR